MTQPLSRAVYDRIYDQYILGRSFVEDKQYYEHSRERYWRSLKYFDKHRPRQATEVLDIGGGQFGILTQEFFGYRATVADAVDQAEGDVNAAGLNFLRLNLMDEDYGLEDRFDAITMLEVIEHIPVPPYITFRKLAKLLRPGGVLFLTTPNGYRFRNILYMLANRRILDHFRYSDNNEPMGHMHEYTLPQLVWQAERAGLEVLGVEQIMSGWKGYSAGPRLLHVLTSPAQVFPHLRNTLVASLRKPA